MVRRRLGRTEFELSPIGFGAFKIGRNQGAKYAHAYDLPNEAEVSRVLNGVLDLGINYIDTAPAYGLSEERIGRAVGHRKDDFVISTKVGEDFEDGRSSFDFTETGVRESIDRSLRRLHLDALDLVFVHSNGDDLSIINHTDVVATLADL
jgi:aryl-alcohol dehydrogenase-like predicted oxidoreductase